MVTAGYADPWLKSCPNRGASPGCISRLPASVARFAGNSGRVPQLPTNYNAPVNLSGSQAVGAYVSPLVIANNTIYGVSADNHLYAIDKQGGNQRWRYDLGSPVRQAPYVVDSNIYLITVNGKVVALADQGSSAGLVWEKQINGAATSTTNLIGNGIKAVGNKLFVGMEESGGIVYLHVFDRFNQGNEISNIDCGLVLKTPVIAGNLIIPGSIFYAKDLDSISQSSIWSRDDLSQPLAPPVFVSPGSKALAEIYIANVDSENNNEIPRISVINANTGDILAKIAGAENTKLLTVSDSYIVALGSGFVRRFNRSDGGRLGYWHRHLRALTGIYQWQSSFGGQRQRGDFIDRFGQWWGHDDRPAPPPSMQAAPALSDSDLDVPGSDSYIWVLRGIQ